MDIIDSIKKKQLLEMLKRINGLYLKTDIPKTTIKKSGDK
jgi:hypothetical protein